jgi:peptide/nickel transport system substrate-binding protein
MMRRLARTQLVITIVLAGALAGGCRKPGPPSAAEDRTYDPRKDPLVNPPSLFEPMPKDPSEVATDETLYLTLAQSPNTLSPLFGSSHYDMTAQEVLYTGPFTFDKGMNWRLNDELVESFQESPDHTEFVMKMKPGFKWQDGQPFTAHDIVYSWEQIRDPRVPCLTFKSDIEPIKQCIALDDRTVKYVQPEPVATRLWNLSFPIIPKHIFEKDKANHPDLKTGDYYNQQARNPIGNGPYRLVEWSESSKIVLERWDGYAGKKPHFKTIIMRIIPDDNVALLSFEKGGVDVVDDLEPQKFAFETNGDTFKRVGYKAWGVQWLFGYIGWNMDGSNPFFKDKRVRYAMTHAFNTQRVLDKVYYNLATRCNGIFHPDSWMYNPQIKLLDYDPSKAGTLLDEAGWKVDPNDGWRYQEINGRKVPFDFTLLIPQGPTIGPKIAAIFQEDLRRLGVKMETRIIEWSSFMEVVEKHEFQAEIAAWGTGTDPDTNWNLWRTEEYKTGRNYGGYSNPRVDELFVMGRREFDFEKRKKIYQEIDKLVYDDQPYIWIYNRPILAVFNRRIHGVQFSPRGITGFDPGFMGWWIAPGPAAAR